MNGRQRLIETLAGRRCDHVPRIPIVMHFAARQIGATYAAFASDHRVLVEANLACATRFGFDQVSCISDPYRETHGFGAVVEYVPEGVPRATPPLAQDRDLGLLATPDLQRDPRMRDRLDAITLYRQRCGERYSILGWVEGPAAEAADLRGVSNFLKDLIQAPDFATQLMARCTTVGIAFAQAQLAAGADMIGVGDAICSQISPRLYRRLVLPHQRELLGAIKAAGGLVRLHICGDITHLLSDLATLPIDILDLDHMVDLRTARSQMGPDCALAGNLDPVAAVCNSTPDAIRPAVAACQAAAGAPYCVAAGCELPVNTPPVNVAALCEPL